MSELVDNNFDKSDLIEAKVPECAINVLRRLNQLPTSLIVENEDVGTTVKIALKTLEKMAKDPALSRFMAKSDAPVVMAEALKKATEISRLSKDAPGVTSDSADIIGSGDLNDRIIENTLTAFAELTTNAKNAEKLELLNSSNQLSQEIKEIVTNKANNPVIVSTGLKIVENCLKSYEKAELKAAEAQLKPLATLAGQICKQYPKVPFISKISESINSLAVGKEAIPIEVEVQPAKVELSKITEELAKEAEMQQAEQKAVIEEVKTAEVAKTIEEPAYVPKIVTVANATEMIAKMDLVADSLDEFIKRAATPGQILKAEEDQISKLIGTIGNFAGKFIYLLFI